MAEPPIAEAIAAFIHWRLSSSIPDCLSEKWRQRPVMMTGR
ncbi:hypothetical protein [Sphingobium sp.]|nr:hypothetical protein [Sphingobium sp.]